MQIRNKRISNDSRNDIVQQLQEENAALKKEVRKLKKDLGNRIQEATRMQQEHKKKFDELIQTMTEGI